MNFSKNTSTAEVEQSERISEYYQFQSQIYDWTRWSFLFGRLGILKKIPFQKNEKFRLAEIGCGTGFNLEYLTKEYSKIKIVGVDVSEEMIQIARKKLLHFPQTKVFHHQPYGTNSNFLTATPPDIILFSYALTMINPQWKELIQKAYQDLPKGGKILVVDFHDSRFQFFKNHMGGHHVRMDSHILPELKKQFQTIHSSVHYAYAGLWQYFMFVGEK